MITEHELFIKKIKKGKRKVTFFRIFILLFLIAIWELAADTGLIDPFLTSSPSRIIKSTLTFINNGTLISHILVSCYETVLGFILGTVFGTLIAILLWWFPFTSKILDPYLVVLNALPKVALAPIIIFWAGNGLKAIIVIALLISIVTTIISVYTGFTEVDKEKLLLMKTFQATKLQTLRYLIIPYSIPIIISTLKISVGLSWVGVIMGEFLVARKGLGFLIVYGGQIAQLDMVMMSIVILAIIAFIMYKLLYLLEIKITKKN